MTTAIISTVGITTDAISKMYGSNIFPPMSTNLHEECYKSVTVML